METFFSILTILIWGAVSAVMVYLIGMAYDQDLWLLIILYAAVGAAALYNMVGELGE
jgi:hypothetical protein